MNKVHFGSSTGKLEEWALVFYGTSKPPYSSMRREQARSAELPASGSSSDDLSEEYSGESRHRKIALSL